MSKQMTQTGQYGGKNMKQRTRLLAFVMTLAMIASLFVSVGLQSSAEAFTGAAYAQTGTTNLTDVKYWDFGDAASYDKFSGTGFGVYSFVPATVGEPGYVSLTYDATPAGDQTVGSSVIHYQIKPKFKTANIVGNNYKYAVVEYRAAKLAADATLNWKTDGGDLRAVMTGTITSADVGVWKKSKVLEINQNALDRLNSPKHVVLWFDTTDTNAEFHISRVLFFKDKFKAEAYAYEEYPVASESLATCVDSFDTVSNAALVLCANTTTAHHSEVPDGATDSETANTFDNTACRTNSKLEIVNDAIYGNRLLVYRGNNCKWNGLSLTVPAGSFAAGTYASITFDIQAAVDAIYNDCYFNPTYNDLRVKVFINGAEIDMDPAANGVQFTSVFLKDCINAPQTVTIQFPTARTLTATDTIQVTFGGRYNAPGDGATDAKRYADGGSFFIDDLMMVAASTPANSGKPAITVDITSVDYDTKTAIVTANIPVTQLASAGVKWEKVSGNGSIASSDTTKATVTLNALTDEVVLRVTSLKDARYTGLYRVTMQDFKAIDFSDDTTYQILRNDASFWGKTAVNNGILDVMYQSGLQDTSGKYSHYMGKLYFKPNVYDIGYRWIMVEYSADTDTSNVKFTARSDAMGNAVQWTVNDTNGSFQLTEPKQIDAYTVGRNMVPQHSSYCFFDDATTSFYQISRILFFRNEADAKAYRAASSSMRILTPAATDIDFDTNTVTLSSVIDNTTETPVVTYTTTATNATVSGNKLTFKANAPATVTVKATATLSDGTVLEAVKDVTYNGTIVMDFSDNATYGTFGDGKGNSPSWVKNKAGAQPTDENDPAATYFGLGVWTDSNTMKIGYQTRLQGSAPATPNEGQYSHYLAKIKFPAAGRYNKAYSYAVVEYRTENVASAYTINLTNDNGGNTVTSASVTPNNGVWQLSAPMQLSTNIADRFTGTGHCSVWFNGDTSTESTYEVSRILFFKSAEEAQSYVDATSHTAQKFTLEMQSIDYTAKTATMSALVIPAVADQGTVTWSYGNVQPADSVASVANGVVTFNSLGYVDVTATHSVFGPKTVGVICNDKIELNFADDTTYKMNGNGKGNDAIWVENKDGKKPTTIDNPNATYFGFGVWEDKDTLKIGYQTRLQGSKPNDPNVSTDAYSHYMAKMMFPAANVYDREYPYMVLEYRTANVTESFYIKFRSDGGGSEVASYYHAPSSVWTISDPLLLNDAIMTCLEQGKHCSVWFDDTRTNPAGTYEISRIMFFRTATDAAAYKNAVLAKTNSWAENIIHTTDATFYCNTGDVVQLTADVQPMSGVQTVTWSIPSAADQAKAMVTPDGKIVFNAAGDVTVRATAPNGYSEDFVVTAKAKLAPDIGVTASKTAVNIGDTVDFGVVVYDMDDVNITWTVSDGTVSKGSEIFSHSFLYSGTYTVTCTVVKGDKTYTDSVKITVTDDTALNGWAVTYAMQQHLKNNTHTVIFRDADGNVISEQQVKYGNSAKIPTYGIDYDLPLDKVMIGWSDNAFNYVTKDIDTKIVLVDEADFE